MKPQIIALVSLAAALTLAAGVAPAHDNSASDVKREVARLREVVLQLHKEVNTLRSSFAEVELDRHQQAIIRIKADLEAAAAERAGLADMDRSRDQDLKDIEGVLATGAAESEERGDFESARFELAVTKQRALAEKSEALAARESELRRRLHTEQQTLRRLEEAVRQSRKGETQ